MVNTKEFMKGFLDYLQSYYAGGQMTGATPPAPMYPNQPRLPLFQESGKKFAEMDMGMQQPMGMQPPMGPMGMDQGMGMGMGMGMPMEQSMAPEALGTELNGLFPGPYDPMRMN